MPMTVDDFSALLRRASQEIYETNRECMRSGELLPTSNEIHPADVEVFGRGVEHGHVVLHAGGRFDTRDRPTGNGRWGLLSRSREGGWYNAEYLPQIAAYVRAIEDWGYTSERVLFELPASALQLDLAVLDDAGRVVVLGEAKRSNVMLDRLLGQVLDRFAEHPPGPETKKRGDEARQLAWRLWAARPSRLWLIGPGSVRSWECSYDPLRLVEEPAPPRAEDLGLAARPAGMLTPPRLASL